MLGTDDATSEATTTPTSEGSGDETAVPTGDTDDTPTPEATAPRAGGTATRAVGEP